MAISQASPGSRRSRLDLASIISSMKKGVSGSHDALVAQLVKPDVEDKLILDVLRASRESMTMIDKDCELLVGALLALDWSVLDTRVIVEYQAFILNLVSAHMCYLRPCLRMLVKNFLLGVRDGELTVDSRSFVNVHSLLKSVSQLVPMVGEVLVPLVSDLYPYVRKPAAVHEYYVRNVLQLCEYLPDKRRVLVNVVVSKLLELDAMSSREDIAERLEGDDTEDADVASERLFPMESEDGVDVDEMRHPEAHKLDLCLTLLLDYVNAVCYVNGELQWESTKKLYRELLRIFDDVILRTFSCAHVQFIIFYVCSFKESLAEGFVDYLWRKVRDVNSQSVFRQSAVAYLTSFIARAKYLNISVVVTTLELMSDWAHGYVRQSSAACDVLHHGPFYSVCQALFYAFIFRHKEILALKKGHKICQKLNFGTIVTSRLNPLKVCLPMIVQTFSGIARMYQLAYCDAIIERNNRSILPVTSLAAGLGPSAQVSRTNLLDSFFPFDPYLLTRSRKFIEPLYLEFRGEPAPEDDSTASEDDDDFDVGMEYESSSAIDAAKHALAVSPSDFLMYGTSPGFQHS